MITQCKVEFDEEQRRALHFRLHGQNRPASRKDVAAYVAAIVETEMSKVVTAYRTGIKTGMVRTRKVNGGEAPKKSKGMKVHKGDGLGPNFLAGRILAFKKAHGRWPVYSEVS